MEEKIRGVTLRGTNYKESDKILTLFTLEKGKISVTARGVRKANAKWKNTAEPFCFSKSVLIEKSGRYTLKESETLDFFYPLRTDMKKYYSAFSALEFTNSFMQENMVAEEYFVLFIEFLKDLAYGDTNPKRLLIRFFYDALKDVGLGVNFTACARCGNEIKSKVFLSIDSGGSVCENCRTQGEKEYSISTYDYVKNLIEENGEINDEKSNDALKFFAYYVSATSGVEIKSISPLIDLR